MKLNFSFLQHSLDIHLLRRFAWLIGAAEDVIGRNPENVGELSEHFSGDGLLAFFVAIVRYWCYADLFRYIISAQFFHLPYFLKAVWFHGMFPPFGKHDSNKKPRDQAKKRK